jgi:hypothetical protein
MCLQYGEYCGCEGPFNILALKFYGPKLIGALPVHFNSEIIVDK